MGKLDGVSVIMVQLCTAKCFEINKTNITPEMKLKSVIWCPNFNTETCNTELKLIKIDDYEEL